MASRWISRTARQKIYDRDNMICVYCLKKCMPGTVAGFTRAQQRAYQKAFMPDFATLDHIVARESVKIAYGAHSDMYAKLLTDPQNLVTVCCACNSSKKDTDLKTWCKATNRNYDAIVKRIKRRIAKAI